MGKIQESHCPGCDICPSVVVGDPTDSINLVTKVNCLIDEKAYPRRLSARDPMAQSIPSPLDWAYQYRQEYPPQGRNLELPSTYLESQRRVEEEKRRRNDADLKRIDAEAWAIGQKVPGLEPMWLEFIRRSGSERTPLVARYALHLME